MAPKRTRTSSSLGETGDDAATVAPSDASLLEDARESLAAFFKKRRTERDGDSIEGIRSSLEEENFLRIFSAMTGKLDSQALCLKFIRMGKFEASRSRQKADLILKAAQSTNKFHMLSIESWSDVLFMVDALVFPKEKTSLATKAWLCMVGCWAGGIDKDSAIPSRVLSVIAKTIKDRSVNIFGSRHTQVVIVLNDDETELEQVHNFETDPGSFYAVYDDEAHSNGWIHHRGTVERKVRIPNGFRGGPIRVMNNHMDSKASLSGEYSDPLVTRIFKQNNIDLPKIFFLKKITDNKEVTPQDTHAHAILRSETLADHDIRHPPVAAPSDRTAVLDSAAGTQSAAPEGDGDAAAPTMLAGA